MLLQSRICSYSVSLVRSRDLLRIQSVRPRAMATQAATGTAERTPLIAIDEARRFMVDCLKAAGASDSHAREHADLLAAADHRGIFSHGMNRLEMYVDDMQNGMCDGKARPKILKESAATAWVDGCNGLGAVVGNYSMDIAIKKAKECGIGFVTAKGSNHYGIAGWYCLRALENGVIGLSGTNTSPLMAPTRAKGAALGTNPIACGAPGLKGDSFMIDMATTAVAVGKLEIARRKGEKIPEGWAQDTQGNTVTDPLAGIEGCLLPVGGSEITSGFKGYGLGALVEVFCGILSGSLFGPNIRKWTEPVAVADLGQFFIAIDPTFFAPGFQDRMSSLLDYFRAMEPIDVNKPVLAPGDPERAYTEKVNEEGGVHYVPNQMETCAALAKRLGVTPLGSY